MNTSLQELININHEYLKLRSTPMRSFHKIEMLTQLLLQIDSVNINNDNELRSIRKNIINKINKHIDYIERY